MKNNIDAVNHEVLDTEGLIDFCIGNAFKYIWRYYTDEVIVCDEETRKRYSKILNDRKR